MRLTRFTDYALRLLIHLAERPGERCTIAEVAAAQRVSEHHLGKVAHALAGAGLVKAARGRMGGLSLARAADAITVGEVVRRLEPTDALADCAECVEAPTCRLPRPLDGAMGAFLAHLDDVMLADVCRPAAKAA